MLYTLSKDGRTVKPFGTNWTTLTSGLGCDKSDDSGAIRTHTLTSTLVVYCCCSVLLSSV